MSKTGHVEASSLLPLPLASLMKKTKTKQIHIFAKHLLDVLFTNHNPEQGLHQRILLENMRSLLTNLRLFFKQTLCMSTEGDALNVPENIK